MMITARHRYQWLWGCLLTGCLLLFVACADDSSDEPKGDTLQLSSVTREGESSPEEVTEGDIKLFVTISNTSTSGSFNRNNGAVIWTNTGAAVKENTQYYFYGYMPNDVDVVYSGSVATPSEGGDFSNGADMALHGLPVFTAEDICVVVGVKRVTDESTTVATKGEYGYLSGIAKQNHVNLLMDHLYTQLKLRFCVDKDYYALRRIHLKTVTLKSSYVARGATIDATVKLRPNNGLAADKVYYSNPVVTRPTEQELCQLLKAGDTDLGTNGYIDLVVAPEQGAESPTYSELSNTVNCPHCLFDPDGTYLSINSTYDVYDTKGNLIREDCPSENKIKVYNAAPGMRKILTLTVAPTYLYVLADPDLDNPTIKIQ